MKRLLKRNKILFFLLFFTILSILFGIFFYANLDMESRGVVASNIDHMIHGENTEPLSFFFNRAISDGLIWIFGISIIGVFFVFFLYFLQVFFFSFEFTSMVSLLGLRKLPSILLSFLPSLFHLFFTFLLSFYSISFSFYLFRFLFLHKNYSFSPIVSKYIKIFLFTLLGLLFSSILEGILLPFLSKIFF